MSTKFQAAVQHRNDVSYVKLGGVIDEDNELGELVDKIPTGTAVIDLGEIERINSCGVRDWVNWLSKLEGNGTRSVLVECSPAIVAQINLVNNFTGSGVVKSFYVPYFCPECNEEKVLLVEAGDMGPPPHEPPTCRCDECNLVMDFDDMADSYFAFLSNQKKVADPHGDKISGAMRDLGRASQSVDRKVRTRASQPNLAPPPGNSMPSLPMPNRSQPPSGAFMAGGNGSSNGPMPMGAMQASTHGHQGQHLGPGHGAGHVHGGHPQQHGAPMQMHGGMPGQQQHHPSQPGQPGMMPGGHMPHVASNHPSGSFPNPALQQQQHPYPQNLPQGMPPGMAQGPGSGAIPRNARPSAFSTNPSGPMVGPSGPRLTGNIPAAQALTGNSFGFAQQKTQPVAAPTRSNALVIVLVMILLAAIGVLAYLVLTK